MGDEVKAAAERLREHRRVMAAMEHPKNSPYTYVEVSTGAAGYVHEAELKDMAIVVTAYLAADWRPIEDAATIRVLRAYFRCSARVQSVVREMVEVVDATDATDDEREAATATISEALFPTPPT